MDETLQSLLGGGLPPGLLTPQQEAAAEQRARNAGLLNLAFGMLQASRGAPGQRAPSLGQVIGQAGPVGVQAYQQSFDQTLQNALRGMQIQEMRRKQEEAQAIRTLAPQLYRTEQIAPPPTDEPGGYIPGAVQPQTRQVLNQAVVNQLMSTPTGMEYLASRVKTQRELAGKTEVVEIFGPSGQPMKVRYNIDTNEYTPLGGEKAEPFQQIDLGNRVELRTPSGKIVGNIAKGAAPVNPSFTMTDSGVLNTKTGQVSPPTDAQGSPIQIDLSARASEDERKSAGFYTRMRASTTIINSPILDDNGNPVLDKNGKQVTIAQLGEKPEVFAEIVGGIIPNWMGGKAAQNFATSSIRQQYENAQQNWVRANLRAESGAAIGVDEMKKEIETYFPQVGDSDQRIQQKAALRKETENSMRQRAGRAISTRPRNITVDY